MFAAGKCRVFPQQNAFWIALLTAIFIGAVWCSWAVAGLFDDTPTQAPAARPAQTPAARPVPNPWNFPRPMVPPPSSEGKAATATPKPAIPATQPARMAVPDEARQRTAAQQIREVFGAQMEAARTPEQRLKLSTTLSDTAAHTDEPDGKFALLIEAENYAVLAGDVSAALLARKSTRQSFDLSAWPAAGELFQRLERNAVSADDRRRLAVAMLAAADDAIAADQFTSARQTGEQALHSARRIEDRELSERAAALLARINACETEKKKIASAFAALAVRADAPQANAAVGKFECFLKHDWARGLPRLARGDDAAVKAIAEGELKAPASAKEQMDLADAWWAYAELQPPLIRESVRLHAGMWYAQASSALSGLSKLKAEERSAEYLKSVAAPTEMAGTAPPAPRFPVEGFDGPAGMLRALPPILFPPTISAWDDDHRLDANEALRKTVVGGIGTFTITVDKLSRLGPNSLTTTNTIAPLGQFTARIRTSFDPSHSDDWAAIHENGTYVVTGQVRTARFTGTELYCFVTECRLAVPAAIAQERGKAAPPVVAAPPALPPSRGPDGKSDFNSLEDLAAAVPLELMPQSRQEWRERDARKQFVDAYIKAFLRKTVTCRITITKISQLQDGSATWLTSQSVPVGSNHLNIDLFISSSDPGLSQLQVGTTCLVSGTINGTATGQDRLGVSIRQVTMFKPQR